MEVWDVPSCSICYEPLAADLIVLKTCSHVYHNACLEKWIGKAPQNRRLCPLCRIKVENGDIIPLNFHINHRSIGEGQSQSDKAQDNHECTSEFLAAVASKFEDDINKLKFQLLEASEKTFELQKSCDSLEASNTQLAAALQESQAANETLDAKVKDLKVRLDASNATESRLEKLLEEKKQAIKKLSSIQYYLSADKALLENNKYALPQVNQRSRDILVQLSTKERLALLITRVSELESINRTLIEARDTWKRKCASISQDYLAIQSEFKRRITTFKKAIEIDPMLPGIDNNTSTPTRRVLTPQTRTVLTPVASPAPSPEPKIAKTPTKSAPREIFKYFRPSNPGKLTKSSTIFKSRR